MVVSYSYAVNVVFPTLSSAKKGVSGNTFVLRPFRLEVKMNAGSVFENSGESTFDQTLDEVIPQDQGVPRIVLSEPQGPDKSRYVREYTLFQNLQKSKFFKPVLDQKAHLDELYSLTLEEVSPKIKASTRLSLGFSSRPQIALHGVAHGFEIPGPTATMQRPGVKFASEDEMHDLLNMLPVHDVNDVASGLRLYDDMIKMSKPFKKSGDDLDYLKEYLLGKRDNFFVNIFAAAPELTDIKNPLYRRAELFRGIHRRLTLHEKEERFRPTPMEMYNRAFVGREKALMSPKIGEMLAIKKMLRTAEVHGFTIDQAAAAIRASGALDVKRRDLEAALKRVFVDNLCTLNDYNILRKLVPLIGPQKPS